MTELEAPPRKLTYSVTEVCELTGLGRTKIMQLIASGSLPSVAIGEKRGGAGRRLVSEESLRQFIRRHETAA